MSDAFGLAGAKISRVGQRNAGMDGTDLAGREDCARIGLVSARMVRDLKGRKKGRPCGRPIVNIRQASGSLKSLILPECWQLSHSQ
jgi:hypothetical protein